MTLCLRGCCQETEATRGKYRYQTEINFGDVKLQKAGMIKFKVIKNEARVTKEGQRERC